MNKTLENQIHQIKKLLGLLANSKEWCNNVT